MAARASPAWSTSRTPDLGARTGEIAVPQRLRGAREAFEGDRQPPGEVDRHARADAERGHREDGDELPGLVHLLGDLLVGRGHPDHACPGRDRRRRGVVGAFFSLVGQAVAGAGGERGGRGAGSGLEPPVGGVDADDDVVVVRPGHGRRVVAEGGGVPGGAAGQFGGGPVVVAVGDQHGQRHREKHHREGGHPEDRGQRALSQWGPFGRHVGIVPAVRQGERRVNQTLIGR